MGHLARLFAVAGLLLVLAACSGAGRDPFVGRWTYDPAQSDIAVPDLVLTPIEGGRLRSEGGGTADYEFRIDGGDSLTANGRVVSWRTVGPRAWTMTKSRDGAVVETSQITLSDDDASLITAGAGLLPDGSDFHRTTTYRRTSGGPGLAGHWRSVSVDTGATWDGYVISRRADGIMLWEIPTDHQSISGPFDGSDLAIVGPGTPAGLTIAVRRTSARELSTTTRNAGEVAEHGSISLSADGSVMTELSWAPGHEDQKSKAVYIRTP